MKRQEGAFGARFRLRRLADAATREEGDLSGSCSQPPFPVLYSRHRRLGSCFPHLEAAISSALNPINAEGSFLN